MATRVCDQCGEKNEVGTEFCAYCHAFLAWDEVEDDGARRTSNVDPIRTDPQPRAEQSIETRVMPRVDVSADGPPAETSAATPARPETPLDPTQGRFSITAGHGEVTLPLGGEPAELALEVTNTSMIVDGYVVQTPGAPGWLRTEAGQVQLLPGTEGILTVRMWIVSESLVPAQQIRLVLRVLSMSQAPAHLDLPVLVTVPVVDAPVRVRAEPRLLRVRDRNAAECTLVVDNSSSNREVRLRFTGTDPEMAVRFHFDPPLLEVGPGASGSVVVGVMATGPEPGQEVSRPLTIAALDGTRSVETLVTFQQATTARTEDPPVTLEVVPSVVRVRDSAVGTARVVADNTGGSAWAHLQLKASDPERVVRISWASPQLHVPPGKTAHADVRFEAPLPEAGAELSRAVTVTAVNGRRTSTATATFVQVRSASPMSTLAVKVEPSVVRVRDADGATVQVILDNRQGRSAVRTFLDGSDPEHAMRLTFMPQTVDVPAGQAVRVDLRLDAWRPEPGQESTRQFTVTATDGHATVSGTGSLVQTASRAAIETLAVRLDPSVLRLSNRRSGRLSAVIDNRNGAQPVRLSMRGDDPENSVRFTFSPAVVDVPPGGWARSYVTVRATRAPGGQEVNRPIAVMASDGRSEVHAEGSIVQSAPERRPLARLLLTLFGGLFMIIGSFRPWIAAGDRPSGLDLDGNAFLAILGQVIDQARIQPALLPFLLLGLNLVSLGLIMIGLGALAIFGLTGRSGRLTRLAALLGVLLLIALFVFFMLIGFPVAPANGAVLVLVGCIAAYIGGLLARR